MFGHHIIEWDGRPYAVRDCSDPTAGTAYRALCEDHDGSRFHHYALAGSVSGAEAAIRGAVPEAHRVLAVVKVEAPYLAAVA
jgi:hypothetical protein